VNLELRVERGVQRRVLAVAVFISDGLEPGGSAVDEPLVELLGDFIATSGDGLRLGMDERKAQREKRKGT